MRAAKIVSLPRLACFCLFLFWAIIKPAYPNSDTHSSCLECHLPHPARVTHEIHSRVDCESCHLEKGIPYRDPVLGRIRFKKDQDWGIDEDVHDNLKNISDKRSCRDCHYQGNLLGAPAAVLPPKSILCLPCHTSTLSVGHPLTVTALIIFGFGMLNLLVIWMRSSASWKNIRDSARIHPLLKVYIFIRALMRALVVNPGLLAQSPTRWLLHGLLIYPLLMRFLWGLVALLGSLHAPQWEFIRIMLDRDHPATAFFFEITGSLMLIAFLVYLFRPKIRHQPLLSDTLDGLPGTDRLGFIFLGSLISSGFLLEALRLTLSGNADSSYAFFGYLLSRIIKGLPALDVIYIYFWYAHFFITAAFVAYLPFSRFKHIFTGPISLAIQSIHEHGRLKRGPDKGD